MIASLNLQATAGVLFMIIGSYFTWLGFLKLTRWARTLGKVVNVVRLAGVPTPEIEFTAADGVARKFFSKMPYRPEEVERLSFIGAIFAPLVFALFGASQLFCGFWSCKGF